MWCCRNYVRDGGSLVSHARCVVCLVPFCRCAALGLTSFSSFPTQIFDLYPFAIAIIVTALKSPKQLGAVTIFLGYMSCNAAILGFVVLFDLVEARLEVLVFSEIINGFNFEPKQRGGRGNW